MNARISGLRADLDAGWRRDARCLDADPDMFTPDVDESGMTARAKQVCQTCRVQEACLDAALSLSDAEDIGVWGGTSPRQRRELRRQLGMAGTPFGERGAA